MAHSEIDKLKNQVIKAKIIEKELIVIVVRMAQESMPPTHYENFSVALLQMAAIRNISLNDIL